MIIKRRDKNGKIRYGVRVSIEGERVWLGTYDRLKKANKVEKDYAPSTPAGPTCGEFARLWLAQDCPRTSGRTLKSETLKVYEYRLRAFIEEFDKEPLDVPRDAAFRWALNHRHDVPFVAALFAHAHDLGLLAANPFAGLGISKGKGRRDKSPPTPQELERLTGACLTELGEYGPQFRAFILFQAYTGLRPGETFALEWRYREVPEGEPPVSYIDGDRIHVKRRLGKHGTIDTPKSGAERTVLLPPPARAALDTFPRSIDLVFRGIRGHQLTTITAGSYFKTAREKAGLPDVQVYDLRHFAAHHLFVTKDLPARVVAVQLGHKDGGALVTRLYGHGYTDALEQLEGAWRGVG